MERWRGRGSGMVVSVLERERERERWRDGYGGDVGESREEGEVISSVSKEGRRGLGVAMSALMSARNDVGVWEAKSCGERERER